MEYKLPEAVPFLSFATSSFVLNWCLPGSGFPINISGWINGMMGEWNPPFGPPLAQSSQWRAPPPHQWCPSMSPALYPHGSQSCHSRLPCCNIVNQLHFNKSCLNTWSNRHIKNTLPTAFTAVLVSWRQSQDSHGLEQQFTLWCLLYKFQSKITC